jgi:polysaccharide chain length determinant protein (PEP-CTERM system associated)
MPGERGDYYTRLQDAMDQLAALQAEQAIQLTRRDQLERQLEGEQPTFGILSSQSTGGARVTQLEEQLEKLLTRFTEKHPDVTALREQIEIELRRAEQLEQPLANGPSVTPNAETLALNALDLNPVYQRMKIDLNETEIRLGETARKISEQGRAVQRLKSLVGTIPEVEAELSRLNRDYEVTRAQHTALLQRLESARLSEQAERDTEEVKFRVIQPPTVPLLPVGPNRPPLLAAVLAFALVGSGALAFVLHQINPVFSTRRTVRDRLGLPVIGVVPLARDRVASAAARRKTVVFASSFVLLFITFVAAYALVGVGGPPLRALVGSVV